MSLLSVEGVSKRFRRGGREIVALRSISMSLEAGELTVVLGTRRSGRSTLLRIAAGLERPDEGRVEFEGADLTRARLALGRRVCFCHGSFSSMEGDRVVDHVAAPLLAQGVQRAAARQAAEQALEIAGVAHCASLPPEDLDGLERMRVAIARGLVPGPRLLVVDDPTAQAGPLQRDPILRLIRTLADDHDTAVLMSTDDAMCVSGADRVLLLDEGELRPEAETPPAEIVPLNTRRIGA
ncbi:MAG TPA: ATP-binding cassette domain-containing protein [Solirubrobacteraceae bacterium]|nr:ATP-binding cassette domain-containing protein [Solirubrobacteraceae bacterium]